MVLALLACNSNLPVPELSPIAGQPAAEVRWTTAGPTIGWLEYSYPGSPTLLSRRETEARTEHEFLLVGVPGGKTAQWRAVWEEEGETQHSVWQPWNVPEFDHPVEPPQVTIQRSDDTGYLVLPDRMQHSFWILGPDGSVVWSKHLDESDYLERVRLVGNRLWYSYNDGQDSAQAGYFGSIGLDGSDASAELVPHHHDFLAFPDRLVYINRISTVGPDDVVWAADELVERVGTEERRLWNSVDGGAAWELHGDKVYNEGIDWTHCNGLAWDAQTEAYWLSCKHQEAVFVVSRDGELLDIVGGPNSTYTLQGTGFGEIHAPYVTEDRLYIFNNSRRDGHGPRGEVYALDRASRSYSLVTSHQHAGAETQVFGNVAPTESGGMAVSFGLAGILDVVDEGGKVRLQAKADGLSYVEYIPALSGPIE